MPASSEHAEDTLFVAESFSRDDVVRAFTEWRDAHKEAAGSLLPEDVLLEVVEAEGERTRYLLRVVKRPNGIAIRTRLHDAAAQGAESAVSELLDQGCDIEGRDPRLFGDGETALITATVNGRLAIMRLLLERGADVNARSASGWTALLRACNAGDTDAARMLLEAGADLNLKNDEGYSARDRIPCDNPELLSLIERWRK